MNLNLHINIVCALFILVVNSAEGMDNSWASSDTIPPQVLVEPVDTIVNCGSPSTFSLLQNWYQNAGGMQAIDETSSFVNYAASPSLDSTLLLFNTSEGCGNTKTVTVQFQAVDSCGNHTATYPATFMTSDTRGPTITRNAFAGFSFCTDQFNANLKQWMLTQGGAIALDNCGAVTWERFAFSDNLGNSGNGFLDTDTIPIPESICNWVVTVSFIVVDECGNQSVTTSGFTVTDNISPRLSAYPADTTYGCDRLPLPNSVFGIDNCTRDPIVRYTEIENRNGQPDECAYYNYSITRTWIVEDACGNTDSHVQVVQIEDRQGPEFTLVDTVMAECSDLDDPMAYFLPKGISDDCSNVNIIYEDQISGEGCNYELLRTYTLSDACGNSATADQLILVQDSTAPVINNVLGNYIIDCDMPNNLSFNSFVTTRLAVATTDECTEVTSFAATPGSYNLNDPSTYPGDAPGALNNVQCGEAPAGFLVYEAVDFVYYDECGNASFYQAIYGIRDTIPPVLSGCGNVDTLEISNGSCEAMHTLQELNVTDDCVELDSFIQYTIISDIESDSPGDPNVPVHSIPISFSGFNTLFLEVEESGTLEIKVKNGDIDEEDEYFIIFSESNDSLGRTPLASAQCSGSEMSIDLSPQQLNNWLTDGEIRFLFFNKFGNINDICPVSEIETTLTFKNATRTITPRSVIVDGVRLPDEKIIDNQIALSVGKHIVSQLVYDCAGNVDSCTYEVVVNDPVPPTITCGSDITINEGSADCQQDLKIPLQLEIQDNCHLGKVYDKTIPSDNDSSYLRFQEIRDGILEAEDVNFTFSNIFPVQLSDQVAQLTILIKADIDQGSELFEIIGEDGSTIGFIGNLEDRFCEPVRQTFNISAALINAWGSDGSIDITAVALGGQDAVNPCGIPDGSGVDQESYIKATLKYSDALVEYAIGNTELLEWQEVEVLQDSLHLSMEGGENLVYMRTVDAAGNYDSCSFTVYVADDIAPEAYCQPAVIFLDPSGIDSYILDPMEIDDSSTDNCSIDSMYVYPDEFTCANLGEEVKVTLVAVDDGGNQDSCSTSVMIRTPIIEPYFEIDICSGDSLLLYANPPPTEISNAYSFNWSGPGFGSLLENPILTNVSSQNNGTYTVTVTGFNGCVASGTVDVNVGLLSTPVIVTEQNEVCRGETILLTTQGITGDATYQWYEGVFPNGLLLESTESPSYLVQPSEGEKFYYLLVLKDGCESNPSAAKRIEVIDPPEVTVFEEFVTVCAGDPIVIGTDIAGGNISYAWEGPNRFFSDKQIPDTIIASEAVEGEYSLIINIGGCVSDTANLLVTVFPKPVTPNLTGGTTFCEGSSITFSVDNVPNADLYIWYKDGNERTTTTDNTLTMDGASSSDSGDWTVRVTEGVCMSDDSAPLQVSIESDLLVSANNDGPGCEGDSVTLNASFVPEATYSWEGPDGFISESQNPGIPAVPGLYSVTITTPAGCDGEASTLVTTTTPAQVTALSSNAQDCVNGDENITFFPTVIPEGDYTYEWTGPNGFTSSDLNAVIEDATSDDNGKYTLFVVSGNCRSLPRSLVIDVTDTPSAPEITGDLTRCVGDSLILEVEEESDQVTYIWNTPQGQRFTNDPVLIIENLQQENRGNYSAAVQIGNCRSVNSATVALTVGNISFQPVITSNSPVCPGDTLKLIATRISEVVYSWSGPGGFTSSEVNPVIPDFGSDNVGAYFLQITSGGCTVESNTENAQFDNPLATPQPVQSQFDVCNDGSVSSLEICVEEIANAGTYILFGMNDNVEIGSSSSPCILIDDLSTLGGENTFYIRAYGINCPSDMSPTITVQLENPPIIDAELEVNDFSLCEDTDITLTSLFGPPDVEVSWESLASSVTMSATSGQSIKVSNFSPGKNEIQYTYSTELCQDFSTGIATIVLGSQAVLQDDQYAFTDLNPRVLPVYDNDLFGENAIISLLTNPSVGQAEVQEDGIRYTPDPRYIGNVIFTYQVCMPECGEECVDAVVMLTVGNSTECNVPTIFTPNEDGYNDFFVIPCLGSGNYPDNKLYIFNQWGVRILEENNYQNDWAGTYNGESLPVGTYYFVIDFNDGSEPMVGFIILER